MKTQNNTTGLRKFGLMVFASLALTFGTLYAEGTEKETNESLINLAIVMNSHDQLIKYKAPETTELENVQMEMNRLEELIELTEVSLKYTAPASVETENTTEELERLESLMAATQNSLRYSAPLEDETIEYARELETLDTMIDHTVAALKYNAPANANEDLIDSGIQYKDENMLAETK